MYSNMKIKILVLLLSVSFLYADNRSFSVFHANGMEKIRIDGANLNTANSAKLVALQIAGDEAESFQFVILPKKDLDKIRVSFRGTDDKDNDLNFDFYRVDYVRTGNPSYQVEWVGLWPDPLIPADKNKSYKVSKNEVLTFWFTVTVPADTKPGMYNATVEITCKSEKVVIPIRIRVRNFTIPRPGKLATPFGLYMNKMSPWYHGPKSTLTLEEYAPWCEFLSKYRLTPKNIGYEYVKKKYKPLPDGTKELVSVDMSDLKKTVGKLSKDYFSPYSYGLYRLPSGPTVEKALKNNYQWCTPEKVAAPVKIHYDEWIRQGFAKDVYVYGVDEPKGEEMYDFLKKTYAIIKEQVPTCKIMQTGNCDNPKLIGLVDIWCPKTTIAGNQFFKDRLKDGDIVWDYVCVSPVQPYANFFIDEPAVDHRVLFWQTKQIGATGLLYWATIWWQGLEPTAYSGEKCFPDERLDFRGHPLFKNTWVHVNGDGVLLYPGPDLKPYSSIRLEVIRDGIEDYEYLAILDELISKVEKIDKYKTPQGRSLLNAARELANVPKEISLDMKNYTKDAANILNRRKAVGDMIEQLMDILVNKDYEKYWKFNMPTGDMD